MSLCEMTMIVFINTHTMIFIHMISTSSKKQKHPTVNIYFAGPGREAAAHQKPSLRGEASLEARSAEARPRLRSEASLEARSAEVPRARRYAAGSNAGASRLQSFSLASLVRRVVFRLRSSARRLRLRFFSLSSKISRPK